MKRNRAFTLLELVVVIGIICVVAALVVGAVLRARRSADQAEALHKMRQLALGVMNYAADNYGELPPEGEGLPTWESAADPENASAWYNSVPPLVGAKTLSDFQEFPGKFYDGGNLLFLPTAQYPDTRLNRPYFAVSYNSKLRSPKSRDRSIRLVNLVDQARTVLFQESGLPGEETLPGQKESNYDGQSKSYASRTVARQEDQTLIIFADGHVGTKAPNKVVSPAGKAFFPQLGDDGGEVVWTPDPNANPND